MVVGRIGQEACLDFKCKDLLSVMLHQSWYLFKKRYLSTCNVGFNHLCQCRIVETGEI